MTAIEERTVIDQAVSVIDQELLRLAARDMVTAAEVTNLLLDLRLLIAPAPAPVSI